jgi:hypothetical protein
MPCDALGSRAVEIRCECGTLRYNCPVRYGRGKSTTTIGNGTPGVSTIGVRDDRQDGHGILPSGPVAQWQSTGLITPGSQVRSLPGSPLLTGAVVDSGVVCVI